MAAIVNTGMEKQDMKRLLMRSKSEPVNCAIGQGTDPGTALLLLDRVKAPRAVEKELNKQFPDARNTRFGMAFVDADVDAKTVLLTINKPLSGIGKKLVKTLKGTGFTKVKLQFDDGSAGEDYSDEEEGEAAPQASAAAAAPSAASAGAPPERPEAPASEAPASEAPASEAPAPEAAAADLSQLTRDLTQLVKRIPGAGAASMPALKDLAVQAQAAIKQGDGAAATDHVEALREALENAGASSSGAGDAAAPDGRTAAATIDKSRLAWVMTRKKVESEISKLHDAISSAYKDHGVAQHLERAFQSKVEKVLGSLDHSLSMKLEDVNKAAPNERGKLVQEAQQIIGRYQAYLDSEPLIAKFDDNPFVPVSVHKTLSASLTALSRSVR